jgi:hypothetical protein
VAAAKMRKGDGRGNGTDTVATAKMRKGDGRGNGTEMAAAGKGVPFGSGLCVLVPTAVVDTSTGQEPGYRSSQP